MRRIEGVTVGIVKEIDAEHACVKVEFPWLNASYRSHWAPIAAPMSGNNRGIFMMPEMDDEVLLAFDRCNVDHPYVVGFLWNGKDKPSEKTNKNRVILTPGGHTLRFEDTTNEKKLILRSSGGHEIVFDDTGNGKTVTVKMKETGTKIVLDDKAGGSITLEGGGRKLELKNNKVQIN
jgi:uncharacterized protein involved in type VI secretion and phage assembly